MSDLFLIENRKQWTAALQRLFPSGIPGSHVWTGPERIAMALQKISGSTDGMALAHLFYPSSGGNDLLGAEWDDRGRVLRLQDGECSFLEVYPVRLTFRSLSSEDHGWAYFHLENGPLPPSGASTDITLADLGTNEDEYFEPEEGGLLSRAEFEEATDLGAYTRTRRYGTSKVVFWSKSSYYNQEDPVRAYDAPHAKVSEEEFFKGMAFVAGKVIGPPSHLTVQ